MKILACGVESLQNPRIIMACAPLRLSWAGGGTDLDAFAYRYGGCVTSATIARYVYVRAWASEERVYICYPPESTLFPAALGAQFPPATVELRVDVPPRSGLGASGAIGVAVVAALAHLHKAVEPIGAAIAGAADIAYKVETEQLNTPGGRQDQLAAITGGFNYMEFGDHRYEVSPFGVLPETIRDLEASLILVFLHPRLSDSGSVQADEVELIRKGDSRTIAALKRQKELANEARRILRHWEPWVFGELLDEAWRVKKEQSPHVTNAFVDEVYDRAKGLGALGGKTCGAGGGGYMMLFAPGAEGPVVEGLKSMGLHTEAVHFTDKGLEVWCGAG